VGFLFPHDCQRLSPIDCPDCQNGAIEDPYCYGDRYGYSTYDDYDDTYYYVGAGYMSSDMGDSGYTSSMEFTEADGADMVRPDDDGGDGGDGGFENDMTGS
jgi:hypothetical protein